MKLYQEEVKALITEDHLIVEQGLAIMIKRFLNKAIFSYADSIDSTLDSLRKNPVDLLILDINISGGNNFEMIKRIREFQKTLKPYFFLRIMKIPMGFGT